MGEAENEDVLDTEQQDTEVIEDQPEGDQVEGDEGGGEGEEEDVIQIGSEEPPASEEATAAPQWVKELRADQKRLKRENAELRAKMGTGQPATQHQRPTLPEKPTLAGLGYDEDEYQAAVEAWHAKKREVDAFEANQQAAAEAQQERVRKLNEAYTASKGSLKVKDFGEAEEVVVEAFNEWQQSIVKVGPVHPGAMVYALGKNPKKLQELASIKDPVKFAVAIGKLETEVKVTKRTSTKPAPESTVRGGSGSAPATSATLDRLEAEAARTGDRSKVIAYKRDQRQKGK